ncbi:MAG: right-handed parallel beta-helix repeat-containing protein [Pseudomonadota bacterium]
MRPVIIRLAVAASAALVVACGAAPEAAFADEAANRQSVGGAQGPSDAASPWEASVLRARRAEAAPPPERDASALVREIQNAKDGAVVVVPSGTYALADLKIRRSITIRGEGDVHFAAARRLEKGVLNPLPGVSLRVENVVFRNATSYDQNGAGVRHDGADLAVVDCVFVDNENGILSTGADDGRIRIERSTFLRNGYGDGYSHGIYVVRARSVSVIDSAFVGTRVGHHVKSLAGETQVRGTLLDDAQGEGSYAVDTSRGGVVSIVDNTVIQNRSAGNYTIFNYDTSRGGEAARIEIRGNRIVNRRSGATLLRNAAAAAVTMEDNEIVNEAGGTLERERR